MLASAIFLVAKNLIASWEGTKQTAGHPCHGSWLSNREKQRTDPHGTEELWVKGARLSTVGFHGCNFQEAPKFQREG